MQMYVDNRGMPLEMLLLSSLKFQTSSNTDTPTWPLYTFIHTSCNMSYHGQVSIAGLCCSLKIKKNHEKTTNCDGCRAAWRVLFTFSN